MIKRLQLENRVERELSGVLLIISMGFWYISVQGLVFILDPSVESNGPSAAALFAGLFMLLLIELMEEGKNFQEAIGFPAAQ
ncbi:MAG: hypothetical protein AAB513_01490 [Patescibacteria group bacterium]